MKTILTLACSSVRKVGERDSLSSFSPSLFAARPEVKPESVPGGPGGAPLVVFGEPIATAETDVWACRSRMPGAWRVTCWIRILIVAE
jgi:hypothetical protein